MDMIRELHTSFQKLLVSCEQLDNGTQSDATGLAQAQWQLISNSGFLDLLLNEEQGGAGLDLAQAHPLLMLTGAHALVTPLLETMVARAVLADFTTDIPDGPLLLLSPARSAQGWWQAHIPDATSASHALVQSGTDLRLVKADDLRFDAFGEAAHLRQASCPEGVLIASCDNGLMAALAAIVRAVQIAGAAESVLELTLRYAAERVQFGKPISRQQAVQQQLAVLSEKVVYARFASARGCSAGLSPVLPLAAVAKIACSSAATEIADLAHAVHGAIGITAEYVLGNYTRRLRQWAMADGGAGFWSRQLGQAHLGSACDTSVQYVTDHLVTSALNNVASVRLKRLT